MKKALIFEGEVVQVEEEEKIFSVAPQLKWVDAETLTEVGDLFDEVEKKVKKRKSSIETLEVRRQKACGTFQNQLDMLYHDMKNNTTTWVDHITAVREEMK